MTLACGLGHGCNAQMCACDQEARQHWRRGELHKAEELYLSMVAHAPRHADSYFNVGLVRAARGDLQGSMDMVEKALKTPSGAPHHSVYHQQLGASMCKVAERQVGSATCLGAWLAMPGIDRQHTDTPERSHPVGPLLAPSIAVCVSRPAQRGGVGDVCDKLHGAWLGVI